MKGARHNKYERFLHTYKYNDAGQLEAVFTSTDAETLTLQAQYEYNESGALTRTELAENLQGIDYVYNIYGQLKAINHPSLDAAKDPGHDGENGFMRDVFGISIDYYDGDYSRPSTPTPIAQQTSLATDQFNGNIKALHFNTQGFGYLGDFNSYIYSYNKNDWLQSANYGSGTLQSVGAGKHKIKFSEDPNQDYKVDHLTYDANGNILSLKRNGVTNDSGSNQMDDFTYNYDGTNKLQYIQDNGDNPNPERYNDLKDQSSNGSSNYFYNSLGQVIADIESKMLYEYNTAGLVTRINTFAESGESGTNEFTLYSQDFENVTETELTNWSLDIGQASINYSGIYNLDGRVCESIGMQYNSSLLLQLVGNRTASRYFDIVPNADHTINLSVIAFQKANTGYKITVYDDNDIVLNSINYNLSLQNIDDPDHPGNNCESYYDQNVSLTFRPQTSRVRFEIELATNQESLDTQVFLDNFEIKLNVVPKKNGIVL